jgi:peptidoglycan/LPS O-acetylase OafA/YrhL
MNRIPTLDGWRGFAILLVLFDHVQAALISGYAHPWMQTGQHGVTVFFVLSGFLITSKLLEGPIDLKRFYIRRFFRLMPAAWAYLAAVGLLSLLGGKSWLSFQEIASCLLFYRNFMSSGQLTIFAGHFWSLSMEEQFYIVWPSLLLLAGFRKTRNLAIAGTVAVALFRFFNWQHYDCIWLSFQTQVRADALLVGCLLAMAFSNTAIRTAAARWTKFCVLPALAVLFYCVAVFHWLPPLIECIAIAALIAASTLHPKSLLARPLSLRPLAWLGTVSYSIYVWQQFFFATRGHSVTIFMMCIMPLFAIGSYYLIERPFTRFGHRLTSGLPRNVKATNAAVAFAQS